MNGIIFSKNQELMLVKEKLQNDYEKLKADEAEKTTKLHELT